MLHYNTGVAEISSPSGVGRLIGMKWFRSNVKHGSRLALFALAIQFVLSFGHFHPIAAQAAPAIQSGAAQSGISYAGILPAPDAVSKSTQQPASDHDSDHKSNDFCAICAVVAMTNAAMVATPPPLPQPQAVEFVYLTIVAEFVDPNSARVAFQPRAPPVS
jgi:Protein of unknown function (DUF2946)